MIRHRLAAVDELEEAAHGLDDRQPGRGRDFLQEVGETIKRIEAHPLRFGLVSGKRGRNIRRARVERFSYVLDDSSIKIFAIAHHARRAGYWPKRLEYVRMA